MKSNSFLNEVQRDFIFTLIERADSTNKPVPKTVKIDGEEVKTFGWTRPSGQDVRSIINKLDLSGSDLGVILGVKARTIRRYKGDEKGGSIIPYLAWKELCLVLCEAQGIS